MFCRNLLRVVFSVLGSVVKGEENNPQLQRSISIVLETLGGSVGCEMPIQILLHRGTYGCKIHDYGFGRS